MLTGPNLVLRRTAQIGERLPLRIELPRGLIGTQAYGHTYAAEVANVRFNMSRIVQPRLVVS